MTGNADTEEIRQAYIRMYDGMISKDEKILNEVLDDSFVLVHMAGMRQPCRLPLTYWADKENKISLKIP